MNEPKKIKKMSIKAINGRVQKMVRMRDKYIEDIDNCHVKLMPGNSKTGKNCWTVSLIPLADCGHNCRECGKECYDIINVCFQPNVQRTRALNSAVHMMDINRYWEEISLGIQYNAVTELRLNVGGDIIYEDLIYIDDVARKNPKCDILFFTKSYEDVNMYLDEHGEFAPNVKCIMSAWKNTPMDNKHNLPTSHVLYVDGTTTAPEYGAVFCKGNCSQCHYNSEGCFALGKGESVIFPAH